MKIILVIILYIGIVSACTQKPVYPEAMSQTIRCIETSPDSALYYLEGYEKVDLTDLIDRIWDLYEAIPFAKPTIELEPYQNISIEDVSSSPYKMYHLTTTRYIMLQWQDVSSSFSYKTNNINTKCVHAKTQILQQLFYKTFKYPNNIKFSYIYGKYKNHEN